MVGLGGEGIPLAVWPLAAWTQVSDTWRREEWPEGPSHRYCPDALLIGRVEVGETLTCHVTRLPSHIPSAQEHGSGEQKRGQPCVGECWRGQEVMRMGGEPGGWGRKAQGIRGGLSQPKQDLGGIHSSRGSGKVGPATWLSLQPLRVPTPHPNRNSGNPPLILHPPHPAWLWGQEPPNYFQMWTQTRGHAGGGG